MIFNDRASWIRPFTTRRYKAQFLMAKFSPHQREFHTLAFIAEGQFNIRYRERSHIVNSGDSILIPAGEIYSFETMNDLNSIVYFHYIDTVEMYRYSKEQLIPDIENLIVTKKFTAAISKFLFSNIESEINKIHYEELILNLLNGLNTTLKNRKKLSYELVKSLIHARNCIADNMFLNFNLEDLSAKCKVDKWSLSRNFKLLFGVSLFSYIHACRIVKAKELLSNQCPIAEVAFECKYADQSHFTRFFKRFVGITPSQWIKLVKSE